MTTKGKPHHNQKGTAPRVRLGGGPFIDVRTMAKLKAWRKNGASFGEIIDRLTTLACDHGFDPATLAYNKKTKSKVPSTAKQ